MSQFLNRKARNSTIFAQFTNLSVLPLVMIFHIDKGIYKMMSQQLSVAAPTQEHPGC